MERVIKFTINLSLCGLAVWVSTFVATLCGLLSGFLMFGKIDDFILNPEVTIVVFLAFLIFTPLSIYFCLKLKRVKSAKFRTFIYILASVSTVSLFVYVASDYLYF